MVYHCAQCFKSMGNKGAFTRHSCVQIAKGPSTVAAACSSDAPEEVALPADSGPEEQATTAVDHAFHDDDGERAGIHVPPLSDGDLAIEIEVDDHHNRAKEQLDGVVIGRDDGFTHPGPSSFADGVVIGRDDGFTHPDPSSFATSTSSYSSSLEESLSELIRVYDIIGDEMMPPALSVESADDTVAAEERRKEELETKLEKLRNCLAEIDKNVCACLALGGFKTRLELEFVHTAVKTNTSRGAAELFWELFTKFSSSGDEASQSRARYKSIWSALLVKSKVLAYGDDARLKEAKDQFHTANPATLVTKTLRFAHSHCEEFEVDVVHLDPSALLAKVFTDFFGSQDGCVPPTPGIGPPCGPTLLPGAAPSCMSTNSLPQEPSSFYDLHSGSKWRDDEAAFRVFFDDPKLKTIPFVIFVDATQLSMYQRSIVPVYIVCAWYSFEERNKHKEILGFFPAKHVEQYIIDRSDLPKVRQQFRQEYFNAIFTSIKGKHGFDYYNQTPVEWKTAPAGEKFILSWLFAASDMEEGDDHCCFSAAWNSEFPCRCCFVPGGMMASTDYVHEHRDLGAFQVEWLERLHDFRARGNIPLTAATRAARVNLSAGRTYHSKSFDMNLNGGPAFSGYSNGIVNYTGKSEAEFDAFRVHLRLGVLIDRMPHDYLHTMGGVCEFVLRNFIVMIEYFDKLPVYPTAEERSRGVEAWTTSAEQRINLVNDILSSMNDGELYTVYGVKAHTFSGSLDSLTGFTNREKISLIPKLLLAINSQRQLFLPEESTDLLRAILVALNDIIQLDAQDTMGWTDSRLELLERAIGGLGPNLNRFLLPLATGPDGKYPPGSNINIMWKIHTMTHWSAFIRAFGSLKMFDTEVFESEHKLYKAMWERCRRLKSSLTEIEILERSMVLRLVNHLLTGIRNLDEKKNALMLDIQEAQGLLDQEVGEDAIITSTSRGDRRAEVKGHEQTSSKSRKRKRAGNASGVHMQLSDSITCHLVRRSGKLLLGPKLSEFIDVNHRHLLDADYFQVHLLRCLQEQTPVSSPDSNHQFESITLHKTGRYKSHAFKAKLGNSSQGKWVTVHAGSSAGFRSFVTWSSPVEDNHILVGHVCTLLTANYEMRTASTTSVIKKHFMIVDVLTPGPRTSRRVNPLTNRVEYVISRSKLPLPYLTYSGRIEVIPLEEDVRTSLGPANIIGELSGRSDIPLTSPLRCYPYEGVYMAPYFP